jgi:hypothetical protein
MVEISGAHALGGIRRRSGKTCARWVEVVGASSAALFPYGPYYFRQILRARETNQLYWATYGPDPKVRTQARRNAGAVRAAIDEGETGNPNEWRNWHAGKTGDDAFALLRRIDARFPPYEHDFGDEIDQHRLARFIRNNYSPAAAPHAMLDAVLSRRAEPDWPSMPQAGKFQAVLNVFHHRMNEIEHSMPSASPHDRELLKIDLTNVVAVREVIARWARTAQNGGNIPLWLVSLLKM